jgi:hypothetical protein
VAAIIDGVIVAGEKLGAGFGSLASSHDGGCSGLGRLVTAPRLVGVALGGLRRGGHHRELWR